MKHLHRLLSRLRWFRNRNHHRPFEAAFRSDVSHALQALEFEREHLRGVARFRSHQSLLEHTLRHVSPELSTWVELGVSTGRSLRLIAATARSLGLAPYIHGFDSFLGLPEDYIPGVPKGSFATSAPRFAEDNIFIHKGWFHETLPEFTRSLTEQIGFVHFDADLYSSTKTGLDSLSPQLGAGTVLLFDELWNCPGVEEHEHRALAEFAAEARVGYRYIGYNENYTQASLMLIVPPAL